MKDEFMNIRVECQRSIERFEYNIMSPEGRLKKDLILVDQHYCKDETEGMKLPLKQECVKDNHINDE